MILVMTLTGKQKRVLKAQGQTMRDDAHLGRAGLNETFVRRVRDLLEKRELVKVRFTDVEGAERKALAEQVCEAIEAECVQVLGRTLLMYRANPELEPSKRKLKETDEAAEA